MNPLAGGPNTGAPGTAASAGRGQPVTVRTGERKRRQPRQSVESGGGHGHARLEGAARAAGVRAALRRDLRVRARAFQRAGPRLAGPAAALPALCSCHCAALGISRAGGISTTTRLKGYLTRWREQRPEALAAAAGQ